LYCFFPIYNIKPGRRKRSIGAVNANTAGGRSSGRGRGRGRTGGCGTGHGGRQNVIMNGVDVTDVHCNFASDEWDKLRSCDSQAYVYAC
jgi:hypothetical protein